jgi:uncharacterized tellurite resistance protein B-like protein
VPETTAPVDIENTKAVAEILLGAAYADGVYVGTEALAIHHILSDITGRKDLPDELEDHLTAFDPDAFDLEATCRRLRVGTPAERRALLALVAEVTEADSVLDLDEDAYLRRLARLIGAAPDEYADLALDVVAVRSLTSPPPLPKG